MPDRWAECSRVGEVAVEKDDGPSREESREWWARPRCGGIMWVEIGSRAWGRRVLSQKDSPSSSSGSSSSLDTDREGNFNGSGSGNVWDGALSR